MNLSKLIEMRYFYPNKQNKGIYFLLFVLWFFYLLTKFIAIVTSGISNLLKNEIDKRKRIR